MRMNIQPSEIQLKKWVETYVPEKDLFFIQEEDLPLFDEELGQVLLIPKDEFFNHASYRQIQLANSYEYWNLSKEVYSVIVATENWIIELPPSKKERLLQIQLKMNRGLIFPLSYFSELPLFLEESVVIEKEKKLIVMTADLWKRMSITEREQLLRKYAQQWDEWTSEETPEHLSLVIRKYANTFPTEGGSNCLAATLFAMTRQEWIIHEWVHPNTFKEMLSRTHQLVETETLIEGDVAVWQAADGQIQHASYHIGNQLFFNKNGQTFFNPWKIICFHELQVEWHQYAINIYRKK